MPSRRLCLALAALLLLPPLAARGHAQAPVERVLVVGDSWAEAVWATRSLSWAFARFGHGDKVEVGDTTAFAGSTAAEWATPAWLAMIDAALQAHPTVDLVHLQIGGNDFLGGWSLHLTQAQEDALFQQIENDVTTVVGHVLAWDPGLQVVLVGYDYPNFEELRLSDPYYAALWQLMGRPTPVQLNDAMLRMSARLARWAAGQSRVHFINHWGLMQHSHGYASLGIPPWTLPRPGNEPQGWRPFAGGDPSLPSPPEALFDAIHLDLKGYRTLTVSCTRWFYDAWFDTHP